MMRKLIVILFCGLVHISTCARMRYEQPLQDSYFRNEMQFREPAIPGDSAFKREHIFPRDTMGQADRFESMRSGPFYGNDEMQPQQQNGDFYRPQPMTPNEPFLQREAIMKRGQMLRGFPSPPNGFAMVLTPCQCSQKPQSFSPMAPQVLEPQNISPMTTQGLTPQSFSSMIPQGFGPAPPPSYPPVSQGNFSPVGTQNLSPLVSPTFPPPAPQSFQPIPSSGLGSLAPQGFSPMSPQETFLPIQPPMPAGPIISQRIMLPKAPVPQLFRPSFCHHVIDVPKIQRLVRQSYRPLPENMQMPQSQSYNNQDYNNNNNNNNNNNDSPSFQGSFSSQTPPQEETSEQSTSNTATPRTPSLPTPLNLAQMSSVC